MKQPSKKILESHPEELIEPLIQYIEQSWEGIESMSSKSDREALSQFVFDSFIGGWMSSMKSYRESTLSALDNEITKRTKAISQEIDANNQTGFFDEVFTDPIAIDKAISSDDLLSKLRLLQQKISRDALALNKCRGSVISKYNEAFPNIRSKVSGLNNIKPKHYDDYDYSTLSDLSISEQLNEEVFSSLINKFEGYDFKKSKSYVNFAKKISTPVIAWEMNEQSIMPSASLFRAIFDYGSEARETYNHYHLQEQINAIKSPEKNQERGLDP